MEDHTLLLSTPGQIMKMTLLAYNDLLNKEYEYKKGCTIRLGQQKKIKTLSLAGYFMWQYKRPELIELIDLKRNVLGKMVHIDLEAKDLTDSVRIKWMLEGIDLIADGQFSKGLNNLGIESSKANDLAKQLTELNFVEREVSESKWYSSMVKASNSFALLKGYRERFELINQNRNGYRQYKAFKAK
jgi:hypothetical protein